MIRYRIKTKEEFIGEFGNRWRDVGSEFVEDMDFLLGEEIDQETINDVIQYKRYNKNLNLSDRNDYFRYKGWSISYSMLKEIKIPSYNDKKILVYD